MVLSAFGGGSTYKCNGITINVGNVCKVVGKYDGSARLKGGLDCCQGAANHATKVLADLGYEKKLTGRELSNCTAMVKGFTGCALGACPSWKLDCPCADTLIDDGPE